MAGSDYYPYAGIIPSLGSPRNPAEIVAEFNAILAAFGLFPALVAGNADKALVVNAGGTAITVTVGDLSLAGDLTLAGDFITAGAFSLQITLTENTVLTIPAGSGTLVSASGEGTTGQRLTSAGVGANPTWVTPDSVVVQAGQAAIEAETNENTYIPPDLAKHIPGVAKAWSWTDRAAAAETEHGFSSVVKGGTGNFDYTFDTVMSSAEYSIVVGNDRDTSNGLNLELLVENQATTGFSINSKVVGGGDQDVIHSVAVFGDI